MRGDNMAEYTATVYASDSYVTRKDTGEITRDATITASAQYAVYTNEKYPYIPAKPDDYISVIAADLPEEYKYKKIVSRILYAYATGKSYSPTSGIPALNSEVRYWIDEYSKFSFFAPVVAAWKNLISLSPGRYVQCSEEQTSGYDLSHPAQISCCGGLTNGCYRDTRQNVSVTFSIQSHLGQNKPYFIYKLEDVVPYVSDAYPQSGFINEKVDNTFNWRLNYNSTNVQGKITQASAKFRWKIADAEEYTEIDISGDTSSYTIPANTITSEQIQWQVIVTSNDGVSSSPSSWYTLSTVDSITNAEPISPKSIYVDGSEPIIFSWDNVTDTGTEPTKSELQYSANSGGSWENLATVDGSAQTTVVAADTLPAGSILWRVRTYNSDYVQGNWSDSATIVVRASPPLPSISSVTNSPRPEIMWQSVGQQAFQIRADYFDSGEIYGTIKKYKIPEFLPEGSVTIYLRVKNSFGIWSEWANAVVDIKNQQISQTILTATAEAYDIQLKWENVASIYYVFRDNILIGKTSETTYKDNLAWGRHVYHVLCATGDYYSVSQNAIARLDIKTACIAEYGVWDWLDLPVVRGRLPALSTQYTGNITYLHFAGRAFPVAEIGEERDVSWSFAFSTTNRECAERMASLFARLVVYKDPRDGACVGVLEGQSRQSDRYGWDFSYTIRAVDYKEVVTYDV